MEILATALTQGEKEAAVAGGVAGATIGIIMSMCFAFYILTVIATWKIFKKAGEPGWKCLIPIYNIYIMYKIVNMKSWFWWILALGVITSLTTSLNIPNYYSMSEAEMANIDIGQYPAVIIVSVITVIAGIWTNIVYAWRTSKVFGHGAGYFIGLLFLQPIFWLILGFDKSKYNKKALKK